MSACNRNLDEVKEVFRSFKYSDQHQTTSLYDTWASLYDQVSGEKHTWCGWKMWYKKWAVSPLTCRLPCVAPFPYFAPVFMSVPFYIYSSDLCFPFLFFPCVLSVQVWSCFLSFILSRCSTWKGKQCLTPEAASCYCWYTCGMFLSAFWNLFKVNGRWHVCDGKSRTKFNSDFIPSDTVTIRSWCSISVAESIGLASTLGIRSLR